MNAYREAEKRPSMEADLKEWINYRRDVEHDLMVKTAETFAASAIGGPIGTTYTSSALADLMKEDLVVIAYEQSLAMAVIDHDSRSTTDTAADRDSAALRRTAIARLAPMLDGWFGLNNLVLALSANIHGAAVGGDPPEWYAASRHLIKDPLVILESNIVGVAISEFFSTAMSTHWLKSMGIDEGFLDIFLEKQLKALTELKVTIERKKDVSVNKGGRFARKLREAVEASEVGNQSELLEVINALERASVQFSPIDYLERKIRVMKGWRAVKAILGESAEELFASLTEGDHTTPADTVRDLFKTGNTRRLRKFLEGWLDTVRSGQAKKLADALNIVIEEEKAYTLARQAEAEAEANNDERADEDNEPTITSEQIERANEFVEAILAQADASVTSRRKKALKALNPARNQRNVSRRELLLRLGISKKAGGEAAPSDNEIQEAVQEALLDDRAGTVNEAIAILTNIDYDSPPEDAVQGLHDNAVQGMDIHNVQANQHPKTPFLSEAALEVGSALTTQVPAVPALKRVAKIVIETVLLEMLGPENQDSLLKTILSTVATLLIEALISGVADNVAAYLFGEGGILEEVQNRFGEDIYERYPQLKRSIIISTVKLAEIAGTLTKYGNGPNFSQNKLIILENDDDPRGIAIDRVEMPTAQTAKNGYAQGATLGSWLLLSAILSSAITAVDSKMAA